MKFKYLLIQLVKILVHLLSIYEFNYLTKNTYIIDYINKAHSHFHQYFNISYRTHYERWNTLHDRDNRISEALEILNILSFQEFFIYIFNFYSILYLFTWEKYAFMPGLTNAIK